MQARERIEKRRKSKKKCNPINGFIRWKKEFVSFPTNSWFIKFPSLIKHAPKAKGITIISAIS